MLANPQATVTSDVKKNAGKVRILNVERNGFSWEQYLHLLHFPLNASSLSL